MLGDAGQLEQRLHHVLSMEQQRPLEGLGDLWQGAM
jgi:hypothetical protein